MPYDLSESLVIGISSNVLFDLTFEHKLYQEKGLNEYYKYQFEHEKDVLKPGSGFNLVKALLKLNTLNPIRRRIEVIIISRNSAETSLRIFNSIEHYKLDICRAILTGGKPVDSYLKALNVDLFLSTNELDVQKAIDKNIAAGLVYSTSKDYDDPINKINIAFDGDAVLFSDESEMIYKEKGLEAFSMHEKENALNPLPEGPFANFLKAISRLQAEFADSEMPIRTALVTARSSPAHERVIRTLRLWNVRIDEVFFLGGLRKAEMLKAFGAHIFFDDQDVHIKPAADVVPSARVPYKTKEKIK